nr:uncharacterized protein LOC127315449 [Lolium perenne]
MEQQFLLVPISSCSPPFLLSRVQPIYTEPSLAASFSTCTAAIVTVPRPDLLDGTLISPHSFLYKTSYPAAYQNLAPYSFLSAATPLFPSSFTLLFLHPERINARFHPRPRPLVAGGLRLHRALLRASTSPPIVIIRLRPRRCAAAASTASPPPPPAVSSRPTASSSPSIDTVATTASSSTSPLDSPWLFRQRRCLHQPSPPTKVAVPGVLVSVRCTEGQHQSHATAKRASAVDTSGRPAPSASVAPPSISIACTRRQRSCFVGSVWCSTRPRHDLMLAQLLDPSVSDLR